MRGNASIAARSRTNGSVRSVFIIILILLIVAAIAIFPTMSGSADRVTLGELRGNMHEIQMGLELYAKEHQGYYPECITSLQFDWSRYITRSIRNGCGSLSR